MVSDKGIASALNASTGKELWKERIGGNFSASPILVGDNMFLLSEEGEVTVLKVGEESCELAKSKLGERSLASPAIVDNDFIVRTASALYRFTKP